jgi:predicted nucleotidyltransferase component of viral defense system
MELNEKYRQQVELVLHLLPLIAREECFALKGGTAINLFERAAPRLSVDIDLCFTLISPREEALNQIDKALGRIAQAIGKSRSDITVSFGSECKLVCQTTSALVKVEVNSTMRGVAFPVRQMRLHEQVTNVYKQDVEITVISKEELWGGKICAALDRQHPRDLFDVALLLKNEGLPRNIILGFLVCLLEHNRPLHELLAPHRLDMSQAYEKQFVGMSNVPFSYEGYLSVRENLIQQVRQSLTQADRQFLLSFKLDEPDWSLFPVTGVEKLPGVLWKRQNIGNLKSKNPKKYCQQVRLLEMALEK